MRSVFKSLIGLGVVVVALAGLSLGAAFYTLSALDRAARSAPPIAAATAASEATTQVLLGLKEIEIAIEGAQRVGALDGAGVDAMALGAEAIAAGAARLGREGVTAAALAEAVAEFLNGERRQISGFLSAVDAALETARAELASAEAARQAELLDISAARGAAVRAASLPAAAAMIVLGVAALAGVLFWRGEAVKADRLHRSEADALRFAYFDGLTGLANRSRFNADASALLADPRRGDAAAVLLVDLDKFKQVNDTHGHDVGDALLAETASRLQAVAAASGGFAARLGGDEFAAVLPHLGDSAALLAFCDRLITAVRKPLITHDLELQPRATIGAALRTAEREPLGRLLKAADLALYKAKQEGRDTYALYDAALARAEMEKTAMLRDLECAASSSTIFARYHPIANVNDRSVVGFFAEMRWLRGDVELPSSVFMPVAAQAGHALALELRLLAESVGEAAAWLAAGAHATRLHLSLSVAHLRRDSLADIVADLLSTSGFPAHLLLLEFNEVDIYDADDAVAFEIERLKTLGVRIGVDNFGSGGGGFRAIRRLGLDSVKLERGYLRDIESSGHGKRVLGGFVDFTTACGVDLIARNVERDSQLQALDRLGVRLAQGPVFGPLLSAEEAVAARLAAMGGRAAA